ncbi:MAG: glycosyltransferase family 2 protein [Nitrososphaerota archaeon]|nr:glycosyltransferase family 2 protein [Nitrososphaerota archaeon]
MVYTEDVLSFDDVSNVSKNAPRTSIRKEVEILAVTVHLENLKDTLECLRSVRNSTGVKVVSVVFDNGSSDSTQIAKIHQAFPDALCFRSKFNLGSAAGSNNAVRLGLDVFNPEFVFLVDNDCVLESHALKEMIMSAHKLGSNAGVIGAKILYYRPANYVITTGGKYLWFLGLVTNSDANQVVTKGTEGNYPRDWVDGCAMLVPTSVIFRLGLLSEESTGFEDQEFCNRVRANGLKVVCQTKAVVWHKVSGSKRARVSKVDGVSVTDLRRYSDNMAKLSPHPVITRMTSIVIGYPLMTLRYLLLTKDQALRFYYVKKLLATVIGAR